jgi:hypothetical protein
MIMPEWLIHRYHREGGIDETDQDQQYCYVTDQEARDEYYSSTPDVLTKYDGGTDADERSRREVTNLQYEDQRQAGTSRQKKIWRLMTHWSERDLAHLPAKQREAQEREMGIVYEAFDEKELDTALAITEHEAPAKMESSGEKALSEQEQIVLQIRRRLSMRQTAKDVESHTQSRAVAPLLSMKAQYEQWTGENAEVCGYGWTGQRSSSGLSDRPPATLGQIHF